ncbi:MAG: Asp23/Gls24 family envelope stress response protein [Anaerolineae bacterium]|nr:MAG: Asp23/Gls24 family envelope stress response protein [Anaerolineae bacterium]
MAETNTIGSINISPRAIATLAHHAAVQTYGVVGLASKSLVNDLTNFVVKDPTHGVDVHYEGDSILIDIYIVVEYGTRIKSVANSVANSVRFNVEKALGLPVEAINVHVQGLRISDPDA